MPGDIVDTLRVRIEGDARAAKGDIDGLATELGHLKESLKALEGMKLNNLVSSKVADNIAKLGSAINSFDAGKIRTLNSQLWVMKDLFSQFVVPNGIGSKLSSVVNALNSVTATPQSSLQMALVVGEIKKLLNVLGEADAERVGAVGKALRSVGALTKLDIKAESVENLKRLIGVLYMIDPEVARDAAESLKPLRSLGAIGSLKEFTPEVFERLRELSHLDFSNLKPLEAISSGLRKVSNSLSTTHKEATKTRSSVRKLGKAFSLANTPIGKLFNSIKRIAFYRLIRSAIKAVTQGFAEGIKNMYYWSQAVGTSFAPSMDRLATAVLYLKNGFASMWSPLIEYAIPIVDRAIDKIVDFFNVVQEGFARLVGAPTWTKALKYPVEYAEALDGATGSAKALQNVLMGFDELNVINTPNDSGRGKAADEKDYSAMFKTMQTNLDDSRNWGQRLADIVNNFVNSVDWEQKGKTLSAKINKLVKPIHDFLDGTDFANIGTSISDFLDGAIKGIDAKLLGDTLLLTFTSAFDLLGGLIKGLADKHTGKELGGKIKDFIKTVLDGLGKWVKETDFIGLLDNLVTITSDIIEGLDVTEILDSIEYVLSHIIFKLPGIILKSIKDSGTMPFKLLFRAIGWDEGADWIEDNIDKPADDFIRSIDNQMKEWEEGYEEGYQNQKKMKKALKETKAAYKGTTKELNNLSNIKYVFTADGIETELGRIRKDLSSTGTSVNSFTSATERSLGDTMPRSFSKLAESSGIALNRITVGTDASTLAQRMDWSSVDSALNTSKEAYNKTSQDIADRHGYIGNSSANMAKAHAEAQRKVRTDANSTATTIENAASRVSKANSSISSSTQNAVNSVHSAFQRLQTEYNNLTFPKKTMTVEVMYKALVSPESVFSTPAANGFTSGIARNSLEKLLQNAPNATNITWKATGGFINPGELFYAGENRIPEIMGKVNGRSAVVGGAEITGISDTIRAQGAREERLLETLIAVVQSKDFSFTPNATNGRAINQALKAYGMVTG